LCLLGVLLFGAACINPRGPIHIFYPLMYVGNVQLQSRITEWAGLVIREYPMLEMELLSLIVLMACVPVAVMMEEVILLVAGLHLSFVAARNVFLIGPWLSPQIGRRLDQALARLSTAEPSDAPASSPPGGAKVVRHSVSLGFAIAVVLGVAASFR